MDRLRTTAITAVTPVVWGTTYLVATEFLPDGRPLLAAAMRALPAGLLLVAAFRRLPSGDWWWKVGVMGALNIGLFFALLFVAAYRLPGGVAATVGAVQPLVVAALAWPFLAERLSRGKVVAGGLGVLGVGLLVLRGEAGLDPLGLAAALGAAVSMASGVVLTKRWGRPAPLLLFTGWQWVAGGLLLAPLALIFEGPPPRLDLTDVAGFFYLGVVGTVLAYALWFRGIERLPASAVSFLSLLSPVVATVVGFVALGEGLTPLQLLGALTVFTGVVLGQRAAAPTQPTGTTVEARPSTVPGERRKYAHVP